MKSNHYCSPALAGLCLAIWCTPVAASELVVHPDNPYFMFYKKRFLVSWGLDNTGFPHATMAAQKINHYPLMHRWQDGEAAMLENNQFPNDSNIHFNEDYFTQLRSDISGAQNNGIAVTIVLYGRSLYQDFSSGGGFGGNPWNACLGGPIDIGSCPAQSGGFSAAGVEEFMTLESYDPADSLTQIYSSYDPGWSMARKIQYRQEEILNKLLSELGDLDGWMFNIMWEIDDIDPTTLRPLAKQWAGWFGGYIHTYGGAQRMVLSGESAVSARTHSAGAWDVAQIDGSQHEALVSYGLGAYPNLDSVGEYANSKPKIMVGYDPWDCNGEIADKLCLSAGCVGGEKVVDFIRASLLAGNGIHPSTPFHFDKCTGSGKQQILDYITVLQDYLATVDSWHNEPGDEISDSTLPTYENYSSFDVGVQDVPDGEGQQGWPRHTTDLPSAVILPGRIEAEDYKVGGEGIGYHDTTLGNSGGVYRFDDVDIQAATDTGGGFNVGWVDPGEWLAFDVETVADGLYSITARVASETAGTKTLHVEVDGGDITGAVSFDDASGWQEYIDVTTHGVSMTAGEHTLRVVFDTDHINLNYVDIQLTGGADAGDGGPHDADGRPDSLPDSLPGDPPDDSGAGDHLGSPDSDLDDGHAGDRGSINDRSGDTVTDVVGGCACSSESSTGISLFLALLLLLGSRSASSKRRYIQTAAITRLFDAWR